MSEIEYLEPLPAKRLDGNETLSETNATVQDFWRWAFSDLRDNTTRGILAEFLVATAVGSTKDLRVVWDNYDIKTPNGTTVEVKSSAYLQSWNQKKLSSLVFGRLRGRAFNAQTNDYDIEPTVRAQVFVFAVQTQSEPSQYDALDVSHWDFWVIPKSVVERNAGKTVGINWVRKHGGEPIKYASLAAVIETVAAKDTE